MFNAMKMMILLLRCHEDTTFSFSTLLLKMFIFILLKILLLYKDEKIYMQKIYKDKRYIAHKRYEDKAMLPMQGIYAGRYARGKRWQLLEDMFSKDTCCCFQDAVNIFKKILYKDAKDAAVWKLKQAAKDTIPHVLPFTYIHKGMGQWAAKAVVTHTIADTHATYIEAAGLYGYNTGRAAVKATRLRRCHATRLQGFLRAADNITIQRQIFVG